MPPDNRTANDALPETFPEAAAQIQQAINHHQLEEARREIDLLREFDMTISPSRLWAASFPPPNRVVAGEHDACAERIQNAAAASAAAI